jgi:beta-N-acetylhexosaminidase
VILATRNASLSPFQKDFGLCLGRKLGKRLIVIATCDPYDFLEEIEEIKNYITIYEPTIPAFKSAVDVMFGLITAVGTLPVGPQPAAQRSRSYIRPFEIAETAIDNIRNLWHTIFPKWTIERQRLAKILAEESGKRFVHEHGFCLSFVGGGHAKIAIIGVLAEHRGRGVGTSLISKAVEALKPTGFSISIGSTFPRLWPGTPIDFSEEAKKFFVHRGMVERDPPYESCD